MISSKSRKNLLISLLIVFSLSTFKESLFNKVDISIVKQGLCEESSGLEPLIIEVDFNEEHLYDYMKWPRAFLWDVEGGKAEPFLEWPEKREDEQILYYSGWMIHKADLTDALIFLRINLQ